MPRSAAAYLPTYDGTRSIRSSVEREFIIIGEAVKVLGRVAPDEFAAMSPLPRLSPATAARLQGHG
jgi:hypothetical protein